MAASVLDERYCFIVDWFDPNAQLTRTYQLFFYPSDNSLEMFDGKQHRTFLKRTKYPSVQLKDFYIGASVNVYSRQLMIKSCGDAFTAQRLSAQQERVLVVIKSKCLPQSHWGNILHLFISRGFQLLKLVGMQLHDKEEVQAFIDARRRIHNPLPSGASDGYDGLVFALELQRQNAITEADSLAGVGVEIIPLPTTEDSFEYQFLFHPERQRPTRFQNTSLVLVKPHALLEGLLGRVVSNLEERSLQVTDAALFQLDRANAEEFLEVYKGVVPEYGNMVDQLTSGAVVALEVGFAPDHPNPNASDIVTTIRDLVGPSDPAIAKHIRPKSLRARLGTDKIKNVVHCTDLVEDAALELEYFFRVLA